MNKIKPYLILIASLLITPAYAVDCTQADITLNFQADVDNFQATYSSGDDCDTVTGNLMIQGAIAGNPGVDAAIINLNGLAALTTINGNLTINYGDNPNPSFRQVSLNSLLGLGNLATIGGNFEILGEAFLDTCSTDLTDISALLTLNSVAGAIDINCNASLANCQVLRPLLDDIDDGAAGPGSGAIPDVGGSVSFSDNACGCNSVDAIFNSVNIDDVTQAEGDADTSTFDFTVSLDSAIACDLELTVDTNDATATVADNDYDAITSQLLTFSAGGDLTQTVSVTVNGDTISEDDETFQLLLANIDGPATIDDGEGLGTIENDDPATLTVTVVEDEIDEDGGSSVAMVERNTADTSEDLVVTLTSDDESEATVPANVTINSGETSAEFIVTAVDDDLDDGTQTAMISADADDFENVPDTIDVLDDDDAELTLTMSASVLENVGTVLATIRRNSPTDEALLVTLTSDDENTATVPSEVLISADEDSAEFEVTIIDNDIAEDNRTVTFTANADDHQGDEFELEVIDEDPAMLTLEISEDEISEDGGNSAATVTRNTDPSNPMTVFINNGDESEISVPATVMIAANQTSASFNITGVNDGIVDGTVTVAVSVSAIDFFPGSDVIDVLDVDPNTLTLSVDPQPVPEDAGVSQALLSRNTDTSVDLTVMLSIDEPSQATVPEQVTIPAGSAAVVFDITIINDDLNDGDQTVEITANADDFDEVSAMLTIEDDDPATLTLTVDTVILQEGSVAVATVERNTDTGTTLQVMISNSDPSEVSVPDMVPIGVGQTSNSFNITALNDGVADGNQLVTISASADGFPEDSSVNMLVTEELPPSPPEIFGDQFED